MKTSSETPVRIGVFQRLPDGERAIDALLRAGFPADSISVVCPECHDDRLPDAVDREDPVPSSTRTGAVTGGSAGAILGGLAAGAGVVATGGVGLLVVGPLLGAAGAGAVAGGFIGAMMGRGVDRDLADQYDRALGRGRILVAVEPAEDAPAPERADRIFAAAGAEPVTLERD